VVSEEGEGGESGGLLSSVLGSGGGEETRELATELAGEPEATGLVEEGGDGGGLATVTGGGTEEET
jgi:hypothetical protein